MTVKEKEIPIPAVLAPSVQEPIVFLEEDEDFDALYEESVKGFHDQDIVSGTVTESENSKFKKDDEVILTGFRVGEIFYGGYSQIAKVNGDFLVKKPKNLTSKQAMILGTAGFTSLMAAFAIKAREEILLGEKVKNVLVTGATGGVGLSLIHI